MEHRLCDERAGHNDTHRCDTLKESAVLPNVVQEVGAAPAAGPMVCPYIREVVSNRI